MSGAHVFSDVDSREVKAVQRTRRIVERQVEKMLELVAGIIDVFADAPLTGNPLAVVQGLLD